MPIIQKREYGKNGAIYSQYRLNIPQNIIDVLRWNGNDELDYTIIHGKLIVTKVITKVITKVVSKTHQG